MAGIATCTRTHLLKPTSTRLSSYFAPEIVMSANNMKTTLNKFSKMRTMRKQTGSAVKQAAVLIPLCIVGGKVSLLYTLRAPNLKLHRGQVSFPGGMEDTGDCCPEDTALRETEEELGITSDRITVWGRGNVIISRHTSVVPVIGHINQFKIHELTVNSNEVCDVFTVPLQRLCHPHNLRHTQFRDTYSTPVFVGGKLRIWGLTAVITNLFLTALLPQDAYFHPVPYVTNT